VPDDYATIQGAMDAAYGGDVVHVVGNQSPPAPFVLMANVALQVDDNVDIDAGGAAVGIMIPRLYYGSCLLGVSLSGFDSCGGGWSPLYVNEPYPVKVSLEGCTISGGTFGISLPYVPSVACSSVVVQNDSIGVYTAALDGGVPIKCSLTSCSMSGVLRG